MSEFCIAANAAFCVGTGIGSVLWVMTGREPGRTPTRGEALKQLISLLQAETFADLLI